MKVFLYVVMTLLFIPTAWAHVPKCSAFGAYADLIQTIECPSDRADYGEYSNYGYYEGGYWCGQAAAAGYWVYNYPTWHIYRSKVEVKQQKQATTIKPEAAQAKDEQIKKQQKQHDSEDSDSWAVYLKEVLIKA